MNDIYITGVVRIEVKECTQRFAGTPHAWAVREIVLHKHSGPPLNIIIEASGTGLRTTIPVRLPSGLDI